MSHRSFRVTLACLASLSAFACGGGGVSYSGSSQARVAEPVRVVAVDRAPPGLHRLGSLSASCRRADVHGAFEGVRFSDLGCSPAFLRGALRDRAASAGGTALVELECDPDDAHAADSRSVDCDAEVWGPADVASLPSPEPLPVNVDPHGAAGPLAPAWGEVDDAWHVLVDYWPAPGAQGLPAVGPEQVSEIDFPRVGYRPLGDVRAHADGTRSMDTLRRALSAAAARLGATSVVGVRCVAGKGTQECVASVAALAVPEQSLAEAGAIVAGAK